MSGPWTCGNHTFPHKSGVIQPDVPRAAAPLHPVYHGGYHDDQPPPLPPSTPPQCSLWHGPVRPSPRPLTTTLASCEGVLSGEGKSVTIYWQSLHPWAGLEDQLPVHNLCPGWSAPPLPGYTPTHTVTRPHSHHPELPALLGTLQPGWQCHRSPAGRLEFPATSLHSLIGRYASKW